MRMLAAAAVAVVTNLSVARVLPQVPVRILALIMVMVQVVLLAVLVGVVMVVAAVAVTLAAVVVAVALAAVVLWRYTSGSCSHAIFIVWLDGSTCGPFPGADSFWLQV